MTNEPKTSKAELERLQRDLGSLLGKAENPVIVAGLDKATGTMLRFAHASYADAVLMSAIIVAEACAMAADLHETEPEALLNVALEELGKIARSALEITQHEHQAGKGGRPA